MRELLLCMHRRMVVHAQSGPPPPGFLGFAKAEFPFIGN